MKLSFPGSVRAGSWLCWFGSDLLCHTDGHVPVGCQAECRGGEHGKILLFDFDCIYNLYLADM